MPNHIAFNVGWLNRRCTVTVFDVRDEQVEVFTRLTRAEADRFFNSYQLAEGQRIVLHDPEGFDDE